MGQLSPPPRTAAPEELGPEIIREGEVGVDLIVVLIAETDVDVSELASIRTTTGHMDHRCFIQGPITMVTQLLFILSLIRGGSQDPFSILDGKHEILC